MATNAYKGRLRPKVCNTKFVLYVHTMSMTYVRILTPIDLCICTLTVLLYMHCILSVKKLWAVQLADRSSAWTNRSVMLAMLIKAKTCVCCHHRQKCIHTCTYVCILVKQTQFQCLWAVQKDMKKCSLKWGKPFIKRKS